MRIVKHLIPIILLICLSSCGDDETCYPSARLGSCCHNDAECGELVCRLSFPSGYCTRDCSLDHECPDDGHCLEFFSTARPQPIVLCLKGCASGQAPCREKYSCQMVTGINSPVCVPAS